MVDSSHSKEDKMLKLVSKFTPSGDQSQIIKELVDGIESSKKH